jgi:uroporphyrinogen-III synthase
MISALPLAGLKIVVTRPREQAKLLVQEITRLGGTCIQLPLLEITPLVDDTYLKSVIARLHEFDLAIFISPNAVHFGMEAIHSAGGLPASLRVATIGSSSAKALHELGASNIIAPKEQFDSESLLAVPELLTVAGKKIVIFRGENGRELLGDTLKSRGAFVENVACYQRRKTAHDMTELLTANPDVLTVSSSEALHNLYNMLDSFNKARMMALPLFVSHVRIATVAQQLGWHNIIQTVDGDKGLLSGLISWSAQRVVR